MTVELHILNAGGRLSPLLECIDQAFREGVREVGSLIPISNLDVVVQANDHVLPEIGLVGHCYQSDVVYISIDPNNSNLLSKFDNLFISALGHELHHAMRHKGPGYGSTLAEALISEGLACHFETELRDGDTPFYAKSFDITDLEDFSLKATKEFGQTSYDHNAWFYGSNVARLPRHAGYSLGFWIVEKYIKSQGIPASLLWSRGHEEFYNHSG